MKNQVIVVESKGVTTVGKILDKAEAVIPKKNIVESAIEEGMRKVAEIASGKMDDPLAVEMKECTSCLKNGIQPFHSVDDFSIVAKTGKRHSQCKKCRSKQASAWQRDPKVRARRKGYQHTYHATYTPKPKAVPHPLADVAHIIEAPEETGLDSLFVAYDKA